MFGVVKLVEVEVNFGGERVVVVMGYVEIGDDRGLLEVEGGGGVKRESGGVGWLA